MMMEVLCGLDRAKVKAFADPDIATEVAELWRTLVCEKGAHVVLRFDSWICIG